MKIAVLLMQVMLWMPAWSQQPSEDEIDLQRFSDDLLGPPEEDADYEELYENTVQIMSSPYDLNKVTEEELKQLHILGDDQIEDFVAYRKEQGKILDVYELQVIPAFDPDAIAKLLPFVTVRDVPSAADGPLLERMFSSGRSYFISRYERTLETKRGSYPSQPKPSRFTGSPDKLYVRLRSVEAGDYSVGFTGEKDAGEKLSFKTDHRPWGFDFTSFHVQVQQKGSIRNLIAGDFQTQFAQGLLLGGAFGLGKGGETVSTTRKSNVGFLPYTSMNESAYLRGVAVTLRAFNAADVSFFYSRAGRDATSGLAADTFSVRSFQTSGLHRTESERDNRRAVKEQSYGVVIQLTKSVLDAGVIFHATHFDIPVRRAPTLYNQFAFAGSENLNTGFFLNYRFQNISFFSEAGQSLSGGRAAVLGMLISPHGNLDVAILYRNYGKNFHTFYSNAFSENTQPANERGVYWGWKYRWNRQYNFTGYVDLFTFPWLGYRRYAPSGGYEWFLRAAYAPSKKVSIFLQVREEMKPRNHSEMTALYRLHEGLRRNVTMHCGYGIADNIHLKSRAQYSSYSTSKQTTEGFALIQDISFRWGRFRFTGRHALFDTDHYDDRQYVYEQDAWLAYSLPAYSGVGVRNYALFEYKVHKQLTIWLRYALTRLTKEGEIGSGPDRIEGNTKNDVKFQARLRF
ncbi:MAG: helix-hairpin-helix domain-containing protein [Cyclobacteriaceae bacterium]